MRTLSEGVGKGVALVALYIQFTVFPLYPVHQRVHPSEAKADISPGVAVYNCSSRPSPHSRTMRSEVDGFSGPYLSRWQHLPVSILHIELLQVEGRLPSPIPQYHNSRPAVFLQALRQFEPAYSLQPLRRVLTVTHRLWLLRLAGLVDIADCEALNIGLEGVERTVAVGTGSTGQWRAVQDQ